MYGGNLPFIDSTIFFRCIKRALTTSFIIVAGIESKCNNIITKILQLSKFWYIERIVKIILRFGRIFYLSK
jgi:hypothetical protein